jgi:hypothetical protein
MQLRVFQILNQWRGQICRRSVWCRRRVAGDFAKAAKEVRGRLLGTMPELEKQFLGVGAYLEPLSTGSQRLVQECETLMRLASGRENGHNLMQDTLSLLAGPLAYIDACLQQRDRLVSLLETCENKTAAMIRIRGDMHETLAPLTYLTVLFKIESARLPPDMRETFVTVTQEIERMRQLVDETFVQNARLLAEAQSTLSTVRARLEAEFRSQAEGLIKKRGQIQEAITILNNQLSNNGERDLRIHNQSRIIAAEVGKIIAGLQFQDIIQQKCAHVVEDLGRPEFHSGSDPARLQACHLDAVCADLDNGLEQVRSGLGSIGRETDRFDEICLKLDGLEGMVAAADGMVQLLLDVLSEVGEIIRVVAELTDQASRTLAPMKDLAGQLTTAVVELAIDMRLIALNAQIRSVQGGEGTGLEVLAARTAVIADETRTVTTKNFSELKILNDGIKEMLATFGDFQRRGSEQLASFHAGRSEVETRLHGMRDSTLDAFAAISGTLTEVRKFSDGLMSALAGIPACRDRFAEAAAQLHSLHERHQTDDPGLNGAAERARTYTMASEHAVHAAVFGKKYEAGDADAELFSAPPSKTTAASPKAAVATPAGEFGQNAELF